MKSIASRVYPILTAIVLSVAAGLLVNARLQFCGQPEPPQPQTDTVAAVEAYQPTLAPPQKVVFVQIEADKPDLEISWAEN